MIVMPHPEGVAVDQRLQQFLRLFSAHEASVAGFVRSLVASREDAREIMQNVAVVLWEKFGEFDESRDFRRWACGVARFEVLAFRRDRARDRHVFDPELLSALADEGLEDVTQDARRLALEQCLEKLPAAHRDVVLAAYEPGTRVDDLARRRGQTVTAVYKALQRIRLILLECVSRTLQEAG